MKGNHCQLIIYRKKKKKHGVGEHLHIGLSLHNADWFDSMIRSSVVFVHVGFKKEKSRYAPTHCKFLLIKQSLLEINWKLMRFFNLHGDRLRKKKTKLIVNKCIQKKKYSSADCSNPQIRQC